LIHALVDCLSAGRLDEDMSANLHRELLARFEGLLEMQPFLRLAEICAALGVSDRMLRSCCEEQLGMSPSTYLRLRRVQQVHRALRSGNPDAASIAEVTRRYGVRDLGRFAASYRALYGELPSATLRRRTPQPLGADPISGGKHPGGKLSAGLHRSWVADSRRKAAGRAYLKVLVWYRRR
jgi:AraC-like DNA-binding protein